jgi:hypothetical protein
VAVITDVDADARHAHVEHGIAQVARPEIELLPKAGRHVRDVRLAIFAEIAAVGVDHRGGVVVDAFLLAFVDRDDQAMWCWRATYPASGEWWGRRARAR